MMSDILRLSCSIENETARNAAKNFAGILEKAFEQYKKLLEEYLKLLKQCEDNNVNVKSQSTKLEEHNKKYYGMSSKISLPPVTSYKDTTSQILPKINRTISAQFEEAPSLCDFDSDFDSTLLNNSKFARKQTESVEITKSPVLIKRHLKSKKGDTSNQNTLSGASKKDACGSLKTEYHPTTVCKPVDENECILLSETDTNNDVVQCTPISKAPITLGVSNLYNVDTTLLHSGKKLKQSKLIFYSDEKHADVILDGREKDLKPLREHVSPTPKKNRKEKADSINKSKDTQEEIIEGSPKSTGRHYKMKRCLKLKRRTPKKHREKTVVETGSASNVFVNRKRDTMLNVSLKENDTTSQWSSPMHTLMEKRHEPYLIRRASTFCASSNAKASISSCHIVSSPESPVLVDIEQACFQSFENLPPEERKVEEVNAIKTHSQTQKRKHSELATSSLSYDDETYFAPEEKARKKHTHVTKDSDSKRESSDQNVLPKCPSVKRDLMDSFDYVPEKKEIKFGNNGKPSRRKSDRAKMTGIDCWECREYYNALGLSEKEIQARQNQCSRHRTRYKKRPLTPEGFWDPLFSDLSSSSN